MPEQDENQADFSVTPGARDEPGRPQVDLQRLAKRILELLKAEARIERERQGIQPTWRKKVRHA